MSDISEKIFVAAGLTIVVSLAVLLTILCACAGYELVHGELYGFPKAPPTQVQLVQPQAEEQK